MRLLIAPPLALTPRQNNRHTTGEKAEVIWEARVRKSSKSSTTPALTLTLTPTPSDACCGRRLTWGALTPHPTTVGRLLRGEWIFASPKTGVEVVSLAESSKRSHGGGYPETGRPTSVTSERNVAAARSNACESLKTKDLKSDPPAGSHGPGI